MNDLNPRIASAIETKSGPDIIMMISNWPHLYADGLADVDDLAEEIASRDGAYYEHNKKVSVVGNRWKAVPLCSVPATWAYREDWFKDAGAGKFPDTWDEWRKVGIALKKKNQPMGQAFGHSLGDPNNWAYSVTWGFGGSEIDQSGKVVINSKETIEAVKFTVAVWKDCLDEGGLAWDDSSNNRAYLASTISATINGASIYFVAKRQFPDIAKVTGHAHMPKGPGGRFYSIGGQGRAVMKYSKNQQVAKEFLRWFMDRPQYDKWMAANDGYVVGPTPAWARPSPGAGAHPGGRAPRAHPRHPDALHRLPVRPRYLAGGQRQSRRAAGQLRRAAELLGEPERHDLPPRVSEHVRLHLHRHGLQAGAGNGRGAPPEPALPVQADRPRGDAASLDRSDRPEHARLAVDVPRDVQRVQLDAPERRAHLAANPLAGRWHHGDGLPDSGQCVEGHAFLRHHSPGRAADRQPRSARGRGDRWRQRLAAVLAGDPAPDQADHAGGGAVLDDRDVRRLPAHLRSDARRTLQQHARTRDLRLRDRHAGGQARSGRVDLALPIPVPPDGHRVSALVHPAERLTDGRPPIRESPQARGHVLHAAHGDGRDDAVPVLLDGDHLRPARRRAVQREDESLLHAPPHPQPLLLPVRADHVPPVGVEHSLHCRRLDWNLTLLWPARWLCPGPPAVPLGAVPRDGDLHHLPRATDAAVHPARRRRQGVRDRRHAVGRDPDVSDVSNPILHLALDGILQDHSAGDRGLRPDRRGEPAPGHDPHQFPARRPRDPVGGHLRLHALLERVSLRARLPLVASAEDDSDRLVHRARARRRLLLGPAHGRRSPGLDPGRPRLLVLRRALRHRSHRRGQGIVAPLP